MAVVFSDDFNRGSLGANWAANKLAGGGASPGSIVANQLAVTPPGDAVVSTVDTPAEFDLKFQVPAVTADYVALFFNVQNSLASTWTGWVLGVDLGSGGNWRLSKKATGGGSVTPITNATKLEGSIDSGDWVRLRRVAGSVQAFWSATGSGWAEVVAVTGDDSVLLPGKFGFEFGHTGTRIDNLTVEDFAGAGPPVNVTPPGVTGTARVGQTLVCDGGVWDPNDAPLGFQWQRLVP